MQLTIMSYNIKVGSWTGRGLAAIADVMAAVAPDVVALQEVDRGLQRTDRVDQTAWLAEWLGYNGVYGPATGGERFGEGGGEYGIALLSRFPVLEHERRLLYHQPLPESERSPDYSIEQRAILGCTVDVGGTPIDVFCTHWDLEPDQRIHQADDTVTFVTGWHPGRPAILMGDFNALPDDPEIATVRAALADAFLVQGVTGEERVTFPSGPLGTRKQDGYGEGIDYMFLSAHWRSIDIDVIREDSPASDHAPVVARLELV